MPRATVILQPAVSQGLRRGIAQLMGAVRPTLGPLSGLVAVAPATRELPIELLDSAALIARRIIALPDADADVGAMLLRQMLWQLHERVGDGTATAAIIFESLFTDGLRYLSAGGDPMRLRTHLEAGLTRALDALQGLVRPLDDYAHVAATLCPDAEIAIAISEVLTHLGPYAPIEIMAGYGRGVEREYVPGTYWSLSGRLGATQGTATIEAAELDAPLILATDVDVEEPSDLEAVLRGALHVGNRSLLLIVRSVSEKVAAFLATAEKSTQFRFVCAKTPGQDTTAQMNALQELALLTGCQPLFRATGATLASVRAADFGRARRVWVSQSNLGLEDGAGDPAAVQAFVAAINAAIDAEPDYGQRHSHYARLGRFLGASAIVRVGGSTESEIKTRKALATRALRTLRGAGIEGVVPGGGAGLLACGDALRQAANSDTDDERRIAYRMLATALDAPFRVIVANSGLLPSDALAEVTRNGRPDGCVGYDVRARRAVNMWEAGLLDSAPVVQAALQHAVKSAAVCLTLAVIVHHANPEQAVNP